MSGCSGTGRIGEAINQGVHYNDNHISQTEVLSRILDELRLIRAQLECVTEERIKREDLSDDN